MEENINNLSTTPSSISKIELKEIKRKAKAYDDIIANQEINIDEQEFKIKPPIMKKIEEKKSYEYICPKCNHEFDGKMDSCPECGEQLEWD